MGIVVDGAQRIVWRQSVKPTRPRPQLRADAGKRCGPAGGLQHFEPARSRFTSFQCNLNERVVVEAEDGRFQRSSERQVVVRRHQRIDERDDVLYFGRVVQFIFFRLLDGDVQFSQFVLHHGKADRAMRHLRWRPDRSAAACEPDRL